MDSELKVKVDVKKIGAELIRVQKRMEVVERNMEEYLRGMEMVLQEIKEAKKEIEKLKKSRDVLENKINSMVEENKMERSLNESLVLEEDDEDGGDRVGEADDVGVGRGEGAGEEEVGMDI